jgi:DNA-binding CsgD family transcriptional regulator
LLKNNDYEKILEFVALIQENHHDYYHNVLNSLKKVFGYTNLSLYLNDNSFQQPTAFYMKNKEIIKKNQRHYDRMELFGNENIQNNYLLTIDDLMSYDQFQKTDYYRNFLKKNTLHYTAFIPLRCGTRVTGVIGIHKSLGSSNFTPNEKQILVSASKFISANLKRSIEYKQLTFSKSMLTRSMSALPIGVVVLDHKLSTLYFNNVAEKYFPGLQNSESNITLTKVKDLILSKINSKTELSNLNLELNYEDLTIKVTASPPPVSGDRNGQQYTIYTYPRPLHKEDPLKQACLEFSLSKRETEIIDLISKGYSNNDIASSLYLSINTVKSHLNNIFNKLGVNSRTSVIHKISAKIG